jgi:hypothetical protein
VATDNSPQLSQQSTSSLSHTSKRSASSKQPSDVRHALLHDEWECYKIKFTVFDPPEEEIYNKGDYMSLIGSIGKQAKNGETVYEQTPPIRMLRAVQPYSWMLGKYGAPMRPWELVLTFKSDQVELPYEIFYYYSKRRQDGSQLAREREPSRKLLLMSPLDYEGTLGSQGSTQQTSKRSWIVNGLVDKVDGNFRGGLFFSKIGDTNIVIGAYPKSENDVIKMSERGITAVVNLQTDEEFQARQIDWKQTKAVYKKHAIRIYRFPLNDMDESAFCASLFTGAQHLNSLLNV